MMENIDPQPVVSSRLKQVNLELGQLAKEHHACRLNSFAFTAVAAVVLTLSVLGLIHLLPAGENDWTRNPDSPVYAIAAQHEEMSALKTALIVGGFVVGLGLLYKARRQCSKQRRLWKREGALRTEMRRLRDKLYVVDLPHPPHPAHHMLDAGNTAPLDPDEARGEYVGVYNPPASHRDHDPERA